MTALPSLGPWLRRCGAALLLSTLLAPLAHAGDRDGDGISNKEDRCPDEAEDRDGYQDEDGCLDPSTPVRISFQDGEGQPLGDVVSSLKGEGGQGAGRGDWQLEAHPGTYALSAEAPGFRAHTERVIVPEQPQAFEVVVPMERLMGQLRVQVRDEAGQPVPGASIALDKAAARSGRDGDLEDRLRPGDHIVRVSAPGFANAVELVTIEADGSAVLEVVLAPLVRDKDSDGIVDEADGCPTEAEDLDGFADTDGCPDPTVATTFVFTDALGHPVRDLDARVMGDGGDGKGGDRFTLDLHPGHYEVFATAPSFEKVDQGVEVPGGVSSHQVSFKVERVWTTLILYVMDDDGAPIDAFWWNLDNGEDSPGDGGGLYAGKMDPGRHVLTVYADQHAPAKATIQLDPGTFAETSITLYRTLIQVTPDKLEISDKVYFDTGKATIRPESFQLLGQVAAVLRAREDILRVRIEGHTDARGSAAANLQLSDDRAASVRAWLLEAGVAPERLSSVGFGEDQPVDDRQVDEAWERNRRVEFFIEAWADIKVDKEIEPREADVEVKTTTERPPQWEGFGVLDGTPPPHHKKILEAE